jgi:drug/metabolite transporter (DMT)-like permease
MLALGFGLTAALLWAVHDLLARKLSQGARLLPMIATVLASGAALLVPVALVAGGWERMTAAAGGIAALSGLTFALAIGALYRAFSLAAVRLVSPVIGAYPLVTFAIAIAQGRPVTAADWAAAAAIVGGITVVALTADRNGPQGNGGRPGVAMAWAALSAVAFAATFALGQAATRVGADLPVILTARLVALAAILALMPVRGGVAWPARGQWPVLAMMGAFDAGALGLVTAAGVLAQAEYAAVASSLFGVLTVLLAAWFLDERMRPVQSFGVGLVFAGIGLLGLQG